MKTNLSLLPKAKPTISKLSPEDCRLAVKWGFANGLLSVRPITKAEQIFIAAKTGQSITAVANAASRPRSPDGEQEKAVPPCEIA